MPLTKYKFFSVLIIENFFYQGFFSQTLTIHRTAWVGGDHLLFHSTTSCRSQTLRHLFATLHVKRLSRILIATLVFTRLLLNEICHLIKLPFDWLINDAMLVCLIDELILGFVTAILTWETVGFELTLTITLALQANRLTKCASHPFFNIVLSFFLIH